MGSYQIKWKNRALKDLDGIDRYLLPRILETAAGLAENPFPRGCKKLTGTEHTYRIRTGDYRIVYDVLHDVLIIQIVRVAHRREVYR